MSAWQLWRPVHVVGLPARWKQAAWPGTNTHVSLVPSSRQTWPALVHSLSLTHWSTVTLASLRSASAAGGASGVPASGLASGAASGVVGASGTLASAGLA